MATDTISINIDQEIFDFLKNKAEPFVDTPNDVLRRLLLGESATQTTSFVRGKRVDTTPTRPMPKVGKDSPPTQVFVDQILENDFGLNFERVSPYQYMFKVGEKHVYFQNFNKENDKLWFRVSEKPLNLLLSNKGNSFLYFTNPSERIAYKIPVSDLSEAMGRSGWKKDYIEVNIDRITSRWSELGWSIGKYLRKY